MSFVIPTIYTAVDRYSSIVKGMQRQNQTFAKSAEVAASKVQRAFHAIGEDRFKKASNAMAAGGIAIVGTLGLAANAAIKFEDRMADIAKTTGLSNEALEQFGKGILKLSTKTRTSIADLQTIGEIGGQLGVATDELMAFTAAADKFVIALGEDYSGGTEAAISSVGKLKSLFEDTRKVPIADVITKAGSAINALGAVGDGTSENINDFALRMGALPRALKPSFTNVAALGTYLEELGIDAQIGAGGLSNFLLVAGKNLGGIASQMKISQRAAKELLETDPTEFAKKFATSLQSLGPDQLALKLRALKIDSQESIKVLGVLGANTQRLTKLQELAAEAYERGTSLAEEAAKKNATTAAKIAIAKNNFQALAITVGTILVPAINKFLDKVIPVIAGISEWINNNRELVTVFVALAAGLGSTLLLLAGFIRTVLIIHKVMVAWKAIQTALNITMSLNPIGIIIAAIGLLIAAITWVVQKTEGWGKQWDATLSWMKSLINLWVLGVKMYFLILYTGFMEMVDGIVKIWYWAQNKLGAISDEQYKKNIALIEAEKAARIKAIKDTAAEMAKEGRKVMAGPGWHVKWKSDSNDEAPTKEGALPALMPTQTIQQTAILQQTQQGKVPVELTIKDQTGGAAQVTGNPMKVPVVTKTFSKPGK